MPKHLLIGAFLAACVAVHVYAKITQPSPSAISPSAVEPQPDGEP